MTINDMWLELTQAGKMTLNLRWAVLPHLPLRAGGGCGPNHGVPAAGGPH